MEHGRNEVRVMTVHGAKGLEAPVVFLPDTCTTAAGGGVSLLELASAERPQSVDAAPFVWDVKGSSSLAAIAEARAQPQRARRPRSATGCSTWR